MAIIIHSECSHGASDSVSAYAPGVAVFYSDEFCSHKRRGCVPRWERIGSATIGSSLIYGPFDAVGQNGSDGAGCGSHDPSLSLGMPAEIGEIEHGGGGDGQILNVVVATEFASMPVVDIQILRSVFVASEPVIVDSASSERDERNRCDELLKVELLRRLVKVGCY